MSTLEQDAPAQAQANETLSALAVPEEAIPDEKSDVEIDPDAPDADSLKQNRKFSKGDIVHMTVIANGARTKGTFTISSCRVNSSKQYWEYQLKDSKGYYGGGAYVREKYLKLERRRG